MARAKSGDKHNAILSAAIQVFGERGLGAATSAISSAAGVAEGTLFKYFSTKDELLNALYREIKVDLADVMMSGFPRKKSVRHRLQHVWEQFVEWGVQNPMQQRVLTQMELWGGLTEESKSAGMAPFVEIQKTVEDAMAERIFKDLPEQCITATVRALSEMTTELVRQNPEEAEKYRSAGFEILWSGIARKQ